jgi:hypothetical protein
LLKNDSNKFRTASGVFSANKNAFFKRDGGERERERERMKEAEIQEKQKKKKEHCFSCFRSQEILFLTPFCVCLKSDWYHLC